MSGPGRTMPFGKHKGTPLSEIETEYLEWVASLEDVRTPWLLDAVAKELDRRRGPGHPPGGVPVSLTEEERSREALEIIKRGTTSMTASGAPQAEKVAAWLRELVEGAS